MNERDCKNCANSKDGHINATETCHECMWENRFVSKQTIDNTRSENMTREEAIEELKGLKYDAYYDEEKEALDMAIEALEQEPTTKNDLAVDCISRKSVITIIQNHWWNCRDIDKLVNDLPSVTPQEPILDKLRAEIEQFADNHCSGDDINIYDVFQILDKYRAESEEI